MLMIFFFSTNVKYTRILHGILAARRASPYQRIDLATGDDAADTDDHVTGCHREALQDVDLAPVWI